MDRQRFLRKLIKPLGVKLGGAMGILLDNKFWACTLNQLASLQPKLGRPISKENAAQIREIACNAFSTLLADPQFSVDLAKAVDFAKSFPPIDTKAPNFQEFLKSFMLLENKILDDAGVDTVASRDLEREIRTVAGFADTKDLDRLKDKIIFLQKLACNSNAAEDPERPFWVAAWRGVKGASLIGMDLGAVGGTAVTFGPAGAAVSGTIVSTSIGFGAALVNDALKGRW
jgi:hypothetical protein